MSNVSPTTIKLEAGGIVTVGSAVTAWMAHWLPVAQFVAAVFACIVGAITLVGMYRRWKKHQDIT